MLDALYGWIQNISVYLIVTAAVLHAVPGKDYGKYIRFFSGLVLILLVFTPIINLMGAGEIFDTSYRSKMSEMDRQEIELAGTLYDEADLSEALGVSVDIQRDETYMEKNAGSGESAQGDRIKVEEIKVGQ